MASRSSISLLSALAWGRLATALVLADPTITPPPVQLRQNDDRFIGWVKTSGSWVSEQCNSGLTWYQGGQYAQCCPTSLASCYAPTACVNGQVIYPYSDQGTTSTIACTDNYNNPSYSICNTVLIFENMHDSQPQTDIVCGESSVNLLFYRNIPISTQSLSSAQLSSSLFPVSTSTPLPSNTNLPSPKIPLAPKKKKKSKAWIAGAVVGPVVGLAAIAAFIKALFRRKKSDFALPNNPSYSSAQQPSQPQHPPFAALAPTGVQQYTEAKPVFSPQATGYNQSVGAFNPHESYNSHTQQPISPITQSTAPSDASRGAPPYGMYTQEARHVYEHPTPGISQLNAAELGGASGPATSELPGHHPTR